MLIYKIISCPHVKAVCPLNQMSESYVSKAGSEFGTSTSFGILIKSKADITPIINLESENNTIQPSILNGIEEEIPNIDLDNSIADKIDTSIKSITATVSSTNGHSVEIDSSDIYKPNTHNIIDSSYWLIHFNWGNSKYHSLNFDTNPWSVDLTITFSDKTVHEHISIYPDR